MWVRDRPLHLLRARRASVVTDHVTVWLMFTHEGRLRCLLFLISTALSDMMFTHPTENQLSETACDNYLFHPMDVGRALSHLESAVKPCDLKAGDYIDIDEDDWQLVTAYNEDGFGEVFIAEPKDGKWKHTWLMYQKKQQDCGDWADDGGTGAGRDEGRSEEEVEVRCIRKEVVLANMDGKLRIPADQLPPRPAFITPHACNGLNGCCQKERDQA
jgi:hypothetical protein